MIWIDALDEPQLVKATANGKPAFMVLATGVDDDEIVFTTEWALLNWARELVKAAESAENAPDYEAWLEALG